MKKIIVGMSGGVDSALSAALLKQQGWKVIGVTLKLYSYDHSLEETEDHKQHCHPLAFIESARKTARELDIEHHVVDHQEVFKKTIIEPFMTSYQRGQTPIPCVQCNRDVKTEALKTLMDSFKADAIATGHYVRRLWEGERAQLHQGMDPQRDQSFFLFALTQDQLDVLHFPLGTYSKQETRDHASSLGLSVSYTPSSQDLCFIAKKSYKTVFSSIEGDMYHEDGRFLGKHPGIHSYTIGQRQGIHIGGQKEPLYVVSLESETNRVIVGPRSSLACSHLVLPRINWLAYDQQKLDEERKAHNLKVKVRSSGNLLSGTLFLEKGCSEGIVELSEPEYGIAPGQACVFYYGTRVMGGGWIGPL